MDGTTVSSFLKSRAVLFSGCPNEVIHPDLSRTSLLFPPRDHLSQNYVDLMDELWFKERNYITRRFLFSSKSLANLREQAKSQGVPQPSRIEALTCLAILGTRRTSVLAHAVNLRQRIKPAKSDNCTGNLFWWGAVAVDTAVQEIQLQGLVELLDEALAMYDDEDFLENLKGEAGFSAMSESMNQLEAILSLDSERSDIFTFTGWSNSFFNDIDFG